MTVSLAMRDTRAARARLGAIYGHVPPVVFFAQSGPAGPVRIGWAQRLAGSLARLYDDAGTPLLVRAVVPGNQPLMHWFRGRHKRWHAQGGWHDGAEAEWIVSDAREFGDLHADAFRWTGTGTAATLMTLRALDPFLAGFERLYQNGCTYEQLVVLTGKSKGEVFATVERMRALGFDLGHRRMYVPRRAAGGGRV